MNLPPVPEWSALAVTELGRNRADRLHASFIATRTKTAPLPAPILRQGRSKALPMVHEFKIVQFVELDENVLRSLAPGAYQIRHLVPSPDRDPGDPCYRIKSAIEVYERVVAESELTLSNSAVP